MFSLTMTSPCEIQGTIKVRRPIYSLGNFEDVDGVVWNVEGLHISDGKTYVQAVPLRNLHKYFSDTSGQSCVPVGTSGSGLISQKWLPYRVEVVDETVGVSG